MTDSPQVSDRVSLTLERTRSAAASQPSRSCVEYPVPLPAPLGFCQVVPGFLARDECVALIARAESAGFASAEGDYPPSYRDNDRLVIDDAALAARLFARLEPHIPKSLPASSGSGSHEAWKLCGLNERLRFCRYRAGQQFQIHQDGVFHRDERRQSRLTFMIYLSDGETFSGGDTLFYAGGPKACGAPEVVARVRPRAGMLIVFDHALWHAGEPVDRGLKHVLRSDIIYECSQTDQTAPFAGHRGYVWTLATLTDGIASGGRDRAIRLWSEGGRQRAVLRGHSQSVLGLVRCGSDRLASVSRDRTLKVWDLSNLSCLHTVVAHRAAALSVVVLPGGDLATSGADHEVKIWSADAQLRGALRGHNGWVWALASLSECGMLASASEDGTVRLWTLMDYQSVGLLPGRVPLRCIATPPDQSCLVVGDCQGRIHVWTELAGHPRLLISLAAHDGAIRSIAFLDAQTFASAGEDGKVRTFRLFDLQLTSEACHANFATDVLPIGDARFASCGYDGKILLHALR